MTRFLLKKGVGQFGPKCLGWHAPCQVGQFTPKYSDRYTGGRFQIPSANLISILAGLKELMIREFDWTFTDDENKDDERAYARIRHYFGDAFHQNANHHTLLIFDNVEDPTRLFSKTEILRLPEGVHILLTTRQLLLTTRQRVEGDASILLVGQLVSELSEQAGIDLLGSYRPFANEIVKQTAGAIARRLGGYALALNVTGVFLEKTPTYSYKLLLKGLEQNDVQMLNQMGNLNEVDLYNYSTKVVSDLFSPLLSGLTAQQRRAVAYASLLPPDSVVLPWIEELLKTDFPELKVAPGESFLLISPWEGLVRELKRLSIWIETNESSVVTMHRVLQDLVMDTLQDSRVDISNKLYTLVDSRALYFRENWYQKSERWEINTLVNFTEASLRIGNPRAIHLSNLACQPLMSLGLYTEASSLLDQAIKTNLSQQNSDDQGPLYSNMAEVKEHLGRFTEAAEWVGKSIAVDEANLRKGHPALGQAYAKMATIQLALGKLTEAETWMTKSIAIAYVNKAELWIMNTISKMHHEPTLEFDYDLDIRYSSMAQIKQNLGKLDEAKKWLQKSITIAEAKYAAFSPELISPYAFMAMILKDLGKLAEAEKFMSKSIAIAEAIYDTAHPQLGIVYSYMALLQQDLGKLSESEEWMKKSLSIEESIYEPTHPRLGTHYSDMALLLYKKGKQEQACQLWLKAYWILYTSLGSQHSNTRNVVSFLKQYCPQCLEEEKADFLTSLLGRDNRTPKPLTTI